MDKQRRVWGCRRRRGGGGMWTEWGLSGQTDGRGGQLGVLRHRWGERGVEGWIPWGSRGSWGSWGGGADRHKGVCRDGGGGAQKDKWKRVYGDRGVTRAPKNRGAAWGPSPMGARRGVRRGLLAALMGQLLHVGGWGCGGGGELRHDPPRGTETRWGGGSPPKPPSTSQPWGSQWQPGRGWEGWGGVWGLRGGSRSPPRGKFEEGEGRIRGEIWGCCPPPW